MSTPTASPSRPPLATDSPPAGRGHAVAPADGCKAPPSIPADALPVDAQPAAFADAPVSLLPTAPAADPRATSPASVVRPEHADRHPCPPSRRPARVRLASAGCGVLGTHLDHQGVARELVLLPGAAGSRLLVDRLLSRGLDALLVAHLSPDEPAGNARVVAELYLADPRRGCRSLCEADLLHPPLEQEPPNRGALDFEATGGSRYSIARVPTQRGSEARWICTRANGDGEQVLSVRDVIGELELAPSVVRASTIEAIRRLRGQPGVSVAALGAEVRRVDASPIVLNRALRSAVLQAVRRREISLSAIAMRCGRVKRDRRGRSSGETSWLARRVGLLPEGGAAAPTPWIHSDVLALISRRGLGIAPREVELG